MKTLPVSRGTHTDLPWDPSGFRAACKIYRIAEQAIPRGLMSNYSCYNLARMHPYS